MNEVGSIVQQPIPTKNLPKSPFSPLNYNIQLSPSVNHKTNYLSERPHRQSDNSPIVHTLHSEWIDSPSVSPNKMPSAVSTSGTTTATMIEDRYEPKYETPSKIKATGQLITPVTDDSKGGSIRIDEKLLSRNSSVLPQEIRKPVVESDIKTIDIIWSMLNTITGKDKMAKVGQYVLRLCIFHCHQTRDYLSDDTLNINIVNARYNDTTKQLNLLKNFIKHPLDFFRIVIILFCSLFTQKFTGVVSGLSMYRQFLRFGKTPFRLRDFYHKFSDAISNNNLDQAVFNRKTLGELIGLYYGVNDESLLLFKLKFLTSKPLYDFVSKHESLAWYYDSILGLITTYENINKFNQQEIDMKIQIQVKNRAKILTRQILGNKSSSSTTTPTNTLATYLKENSNNSDAKDLKDIQFKKYNAYLDLYKWLSDFIFDSYTVFHMPLPFKTFQIWFGLSASSLSTYKIFRETRRKLMEQKEKQQQQQQ